MHRIHEYVLPNCPESIVYMRLNSKILDIQFNNGSFCVWAISKDTEEKEPRKIRIFIEELPISNSIAVSCEYISTVVYRFSTMHFFEEIADIDLQEVLDHPFYMIIDDQGKLYWSNEFGWCNRDDATEFTESERYSANLPDGGKWLRASPI